MERRAQVAQVIPVAWLTGGGKVKELSYAETTDALIGIVEWPTANEFLRSNNWKGRDYSADVKAIEKLMTQGYVDQTLYRGIDGLSGKYYFGKEISDIKVGDILKDRGMMSTSKIGVPEGFGGDSYGEPVTLEISVKASTPRLDVVRELSSLPLSSEQRDIFNQIKSQKEVLLPRNTSMRVTKIWRDKEGTKHIALSTLDSNTPASVRTTGRAKGRTRHK